MQYVVLKRCGARLRSSFDDNLFLEKIQRVVPIDTLESLSDVDNDAR